MDYVPRYQWSVRQPNPGLLPLSKPPERMFIHYRGDGGAPWGYDAEVAALRADTAWHMDHNGWRFLAYSWAVGQSGRIYEGRGWGKAGGHTEGWNGGPKDPHSSHAILWIGGQDGTPSPEAIQSINTVIAEGERLYGVVPIAPHSSVNQTTCPGDRLRALIVNGSIHHPTPAPPPEEDDMKTVLLSDSKGRVWYVFGNVKVHVPTPAHHNFLRFMGVQDLTGQPNDIWLETCGVLTP